MANKKITDIDTITSINDTDKIVVTETDTSVKRISYANLMKSVNDKMDSNTSQMNEKANNTDNSRNTTAKDVTGSLNELLSLINAGTLKVKIGVVARDLSLASSNQAITGVGFQPKAVIFLASTTTATNVMSIGFDNLASKFTCVSQGSGLWGADGTNAITSIVSGGNSQNAKIATLDADGFTLAWTKTGSPTGVVYVGYLAIR